MSRTDHLPMGLIHSSRENGSHSLAHPEAAGNVVDPPHTQEHAECTSLRQVVHHPAGISWSSVLMDNWSEYIFVTHPRILSTACRCGC